MNDSFNTEQVYDASTAEVWQALTDTGLLREWYFPQITYFEPKIGAAFEFADDGSPYQKEWRITGLEPNRLLAHSWQYKGYPGSSEVTFELFMHGEKTRLRLTHTGLASFPDDPHFSYRRFERGWETILGQNLRYCLEHHTE